MKLSKNDKIVTAFGEKSSGPGWANHLVWVIVRDRLGNLRQECLQPDEQTSEMEIMYPFSNLAHTRMVAEIEYMVKKGRPK